MTASRRSPSSTLGLILFVIIILAAWAAAAQTIETKPLVLEFGTWDVARYLFAVVICTAIIEGTRWFVPGWEREKGVRLPGLARRILFGMVLVWGQVAALVGWPDHTFVRTPWPGELVAATGAGLIVSVAAVVFNELLWKRAVHFVQDRLGVMPKRMKQRRLAGTTDQFKVARAEELGTGPESVADIAEPPQS
jgi:hypothetical protein